MATIPFYPNSSAVAITRRNMFNRMLETEKKIKLERMRKTNFPLQLSLPARATGRLYDTSAGDLQQKAVADKSGSLFSKANMDEHSPSSQASSNVNGDMPGLEKKPRIKAQVTTEPDTISTAVMNYDNVSDVSSICHSPTWSNFGGNKKKKQKKIAAKQREEEQKRKSESTNNEAVKSNRLTKPPPESQRLIGSTSKPGLQTVPQSLLDEPIDRMHNGSTQFSLTPLSSSLGNGFIGGVRLKLVSDRINLRSNIRLDTGDDGDDRKDGTSQASTTSLSEHLKLGDLGSRTFSIQGPPQPDTSDLEAFRRTLSLPLLDSYQNETSFAVRIAKEAKLMENIRPGSSLGPAIETSRRPRTPRYSTGWPYSSDLRLPKEETSRDDKIRAAVQADLASIRSGSPQRRRHSSRRSPDRTSTRSIDSIENPHAKDFHPRSHRRPDRSEIERGSGTITQHENNYASHLISEPLTPPYDEQPKPDDSDTISETQSNSEISRQENNEDVQYLELDRYHTFLVQSTTPQLPVFSKDVTTDTLSSHDQNKAKALESQKAGFRSAAWATLSRKSTGPKSSDSSFEDAKNFLRVNHSESIRPFSSGSTSTLTTRTVLKKRSGNKADQILGAAISSLRPQMNLAPKMAPSASRSGSSTTERSDDPDHGSINDFSNSTTPMTSRPQSYQPLGTDGHKEFLSTSTSAAQRHTGPVEVPSNVEMEGENTGTNGQAVKSIASRPSDIINPKSTPPPDEGLDFLPELKHQALARPQPRPSGRRSVTADVVPSQTTNSLSVTMEKKGRHSVLKQSSGPEARVARSSDSPSDYLRDARLSAPRLPKSRRLGVNSSAESNSTSNEQDKPVAKMFVICCSCKFFHDLPSKIYEAMATPDSLVEDRALKVSGQVTTMVRCPWCSHPMSTQCCAGYAAVVHLRERFH